VRYRSSAPDRSCSSACSTCVFNYQNGVFTASTMDLVSNLFINIACVVLGLIIIKGFGGDVR
jgi:hypothetical protein